MTQLLKIALLQISPAKNEQDALQKGEAYCKLAVKDGVDIILFPELWNIGYDFPDLKDKVGTAQWKQKAIGKDSAFVNNFRNLAKRLGVAIAITYLEDCGSSKPKNSATLFDRNGNERLHYSKVHTCDFGPESLTQPGNSFGTATLDTQAGEVEIGVMICFDREQPESARVLMLKGAEITLVPNACDIGRAQLEQLSTRAYENMMGMAMTNYPAPQNNGCSAAFSPIVVDEHHQDVENCLLQAGPDEGIYIAEFNMNVIRSWRNHQIWGNAYRRPAHYAELSSKIVTNPFLRKPHH